MAAGVLIKNAEALEVMEKVDTLVVDKTGTLGVLVIPSEIKVISSKQVQINGNASFQ
jgi:cation transport ATPase